MVTRAAEPSTQPSLRRLRQFGIRPNRELGQNFLIDSNMLDVIGNLADVAAEDVVLEIGGGLGVLSEYLAERVSHLHVVEVDRKLEAPLREAVEPFTAVTLHFVDAMKLDFSTLEPKPNKLIANLPYGIAASSVLKSIEELPTLQQWVVMSQKEVGERLAAAPRSSAYGVPSVLAQIPCEVKVARRVSRNVFRPMPNVDSVLVTLTRTGPAAPESLRQLVRQAFAHRRKALARSLALAPGAPDHIRDRARGALEELGFPAKARAERLSPSDFSALAEKLAKDPK